MLLNFDIIIMVIFLMSLVSRFQFSRTGLPDVSVSVENIAVDTIGHVEQYALQFMVSPDTTLPIA